MSFSAESLNRWSSTNASPAERVSDMDFIVRLFTLEMILVVATQKIAVPIGSAETSQVALALLIHAGVIGILAIKGLLRASVLSLILFCGFTFVTGFTAVVLASATYSLMSLLLLIIISTFYVFRIELDREHYLKWLANFQLIAVAAGSLVFFNWATQLVGLGIVDLNSLIPKRLLYLHYNYIQPIHWGSPWMKPNAVFFLETSHISQFIAMAIVIELTCFFRLRYLAFFGAALLCTFGGTGMLTLALSIPFVLGRIPKGIIVAGIVALPIAYGGAKAIGLTQNIEGRVSEFGTRGSSGEMRFSRPAEAVVDALFGEETDLFIGKGAGAMPKGQSQLGANFAWAPYSKVFVEYGIVAFACWALLIITAMFGHGVPFAVSWVVFLQYQFMNGSLNVPLHTIYAVLLAAGVVMVKSRAPAPVPAGPGSAT
ncbi:MAG: hypothetical protein KKC10_19805 [Alphaproteobacteria bacterium]|nr:hypothetical protein [Alphaproteobacteria bacterium]